MALSRNFSLLIESMKSDSYYHQIQERRDKVERKEDREERREGKRRKKFEDDEKDFKLNPFIDSLESLKNSIVADYNDAQQRQNPDSNLAGTETAKKFLVLFTRLLERVAKLKAEAVYQREKDGKFLEVSKDMALINNFRNNYSNLFDDFTETSQNYRNEWAQESEKVIADIEYPSITKPLQDAEILFAEAKNDLVKILETIRLNAQQLPANTQGATGAGGTGSTVLQGELTSAIKQRDAAYDGKDGEIVKEVKKIIYEKFKKYEAVSGTKDWGIVYKSYPKVSGTLRANTANVIKDVKNGLRKSNKELENDKSGNITPEFYTVLKNYKETNESLKSSSDKLISFDNFIKFKMNEEFDVEAVKSGRGSSEKKVKAKQDPKGEANPSTPFKNKEEGDYFRAYVNERDPDYAKKIDLDKSGEFNNRYIRKAFAQYGQQYTKEIEEGTYKTPGKTVVKTLTNDELSKVFDFIKSSIDSENNWFSSGILQTLKPKVELLPSGNSFYIKVSYGSPSKESFCIYVNHTCSYIIEQAPEKRFDADLIIPEGKEKDPSSWQATFRNGQGTFSVKEVATGKVKDKITGKEAEAKAQEGEKAKKNYSDAQYQEMVSDLLLNMKGMNTAYEGNLVVNLFKDKIKSQGDLEALNNAWGTKDGDTLKQWLYDDSLWARVKKVLKDKGLSVSMMAAGE